MDKYLIIVNDKANNSQAFKSAKALDTLLSNSERKYIDAENINYNEILNETDAEIRIVIAGGDGTLNRFINTVDTDHLTRDIYYYPAGSGNDFARDVGKGREDPPFVINEYLKDLPTVTVNGKTSKFLNGIGYGIDGYCCEIGDKIRVASDKPVNYTAIAIKGLLGGFTPTNATVTVDGKKYKFAKTWLAPTMNGRYFGGGIMPTPNQDRLNPDRYVSIAIMQGIGRFNALRIFPSMFKGEHIKYKKVIHIRKAFDVKVQFDRPTALQIDGETVLNVLEYSVSSCKTAKTIQTDTKSFVKG